MDYKFKGGAWLLGWVWHAAVRQSVGQPVTQLPWNQARQHPSQPGQQPTLQPRAPACPPRLLLFSAGEELLKRSGVPYTIVRPGGLSSEPAGQAVLVAAQVSRLAGRRLLGASLARQAQRDPP